MLTDLNKEACFELLESNYIGHLAYVYKNEPYVIPITYYFDKEFIRVICYTGEGHKTRALRSNSAVALEVAEIESLDRYKSILVHGIFKELSGVDARSELHKFYLGVKKLISEKDQKEVHFIPEFSTKTHPEALPFVYKIKIQYISGKQTRPNPSIENANKVISTL